MNNNNASRIMRCMRHNRWRDAWQWGDTYPISMLYCPVCDREKRINKPKKSLETLKSLEAKVARYIKQHNLHNPKNKLRYCFDKYFPLVIITNSESGDEVCGEAFNRLDLQNTFNILKHRIREALKLDWSDGFQNVILDSRWDQSQYDVKEAQKDSMRERLKRMDDRMVDPLDSPWTMDFKDWGEPIGDCSDTVNIRNKTILPTDSKERKTYPIFTGVLQYFPRAIASVANQSYKGNQKHHPDKPLHWDKAKSDDHSDCVIRHLIDSLDPNCNKIEELTAATWRMMALLETAIIEEGK